MHQLNLSSNLFLGTPELRKFQQFIREEGLHRFIKEAAGSFGLISKGDGSNAKIETGANAGTIKHDSIIGINKYGEYIIAGSKDNITVPADGQPYLVSISYLKSHAEIGTVSIDVSGNLTGIGTSFLSTLRGQPNAANKVRFIDSAQNINSYSVVEVVSDTEAVLDGSFAAETNIKFAVVGAFTPGVVPSADNELIYAYDGCSVELTSELAFVPDPGSKFVIARVKNNAGTVVVEDQRSEFFTIKNIYRDLESNLNPLISPESVKYNVYSTSRDKSLVRMGWGMMSRNWTFDSSTRKVTINGGAGGLYATTADFQDGQFDGWLLYLKDRVYKIISSTRVATQLNLILDNLDPAVFENDGDPSPQITIVPDADEIIINFQDTTHQDSTHIFHLPINAAHHVCELPNGTNPITYNISYRYRRGSLYTSWMKSLRSSWYPESAYNEAGDKIGTPLRVTAEQPIVIVNPDTDSHKSKLLKLDTGDLKGVEIRTINNAQPLIELVVGRDKQNQRLASMGSYDLTTDHYINIKSVGAKEGNIFYLDFIFDVNLKGYKVFVVADYNTTGDPGNILFELEQFSIDEARKGNLVVKCIYDGRGWRGIVQSSVTPSSEWIIVGTSEAVPYNNGWRGAIASDPAYIKMMIPLQYRKNSLGAIELRGAAVATDVTVNRAVVTFPVGMRPIGGQSFFAYNNYVAPNTSTGMYCDVEPDGSLVAPRTGISAGKFITFDSVQFYPAP